MTTNDIAILENYNDSDIETEVILACDKENILKKILELKSPYKEIMKYYYIDEYSLESIANKMNVTKGTLKMQIYRAKKILKEKLGGGNYYDK